LAARSPGVGCEGWSTEDRRLCRACAGSPGMSASGSREAPHQAHHRYHLGDAGLLPDLAVRLPRSARIRRVHIASLSGASSFGKGCRYLPRSQAAPSLDRSRPPAPSAFTNQSGSHHRGAGRAPTARNPCVQADSEQEARVSRPTRAPSSGRNPCVQARSGEGAGISSWARVREVLRVRSTD